MSVEAGLDAAAKVYDDLDDLFGSWADDSAVAGALAEQRSLDPKDWA